MHNKGKRLASYKIFMTAGILSICLSFAIFLWWITGRGVQPLGPDLPRGGDFTLQSADGPFSLVDLRGKAVLITFGYTMCPDVCPFQLSTISEAFSGLNEEELGLVQGVFISIDPERDTPSRLKEYTGHFHQQIVGLTGTPEEIGKVANQYGVSYFKEKVADSAMGYSFAHTSKFYLVDLRGNLKKTLSHNSDPETVINAIRLVI